jgi:hypothetical protein
MSDELHQKPIAEGAGCHCVSKQIANLAPERNFPLFVSKWLEARIGSSTLPVIIGPPVKPWVRM